MSKQTKDVHVVVTPRHIVTIALLILNLHEFLEFFEKFVLQNIRKEVQINYRKKDDFFYSKKKKGNTYPLKLLEKQNNNRDFSLIPFFYIGIIATLPNFIVHHFVSRDILCKSLLFFLYLLFDKKNSQFQMTLLIKMSPLFI